MILNKKMTQRVLTLLLCQSFITDGNCSTVSLNNKISNTKINNLVQNFEKKINKAQSLLDEGISEALIKKAFSSQEFKMIEQMRFDQEMKDIDQSPTYRYAHLAAIGESFIAQEKWSEYLLGQGRYSESAKWYIRAALNGHADCNSYLNNLMSKEQFTHHPGQSLQKNLADYWEKTYPCENVKHLISISNPLIEKE